MYQDSYFTGNKTEERKKALAKSLHAITGQELKGLSDTIFHDDSHPWKEAVLNFIAENPGATFHQGNTMDGIHLVYCKEADKGIWYVANGVGPMQEKGRKVMKELIEKIQPNH